MRDIDKALKLYTMMADRCEKNGFSPHQAKVYREMVEFMRGCETAEEASVKIKNSKYYLAPGAAVLQDNLSAMEKACREINMPEAADVYKKKIEEIDADPKAMYETGYERTAGNIKTQYMETYNAFMIIYVIYMESRCRNIMSYRRSIVEMLNEEFKKLSRPSSDFTVLAKLPKFRELIPANDLGYARFTEAIPKLAANEPDYTENRRWLDDTFKQMKEIIKPEREAIRETGKGNIARTMQSAAIAVPGDSKTSVYTYTDEETSPMPVITFTPKKSG